MLNFQTERTLARFFKAIANVETQVEAIKQILADNDRFDPYTAFKRIDSKNLGYINAKGLEAFLNQNTVRASERDIRHLLSLLNCDKDHCVSYSNFLDAILSVNKPNLNKSATCQHPIYLTREKELPYDIECYLSMLFEKEITAYRTREDLKQELLHFFNLDATKIFDLVDSDKTGYLDSSKLYKLFLRSNTAVTDDEINAIFRRIGRNRDGKSL